MPVDMNESLAEKKKRIKQLEANQEKWKEYYFPHYNKVKSPSFHRRSSRRLITNFLRKKHYTCARRWARGLAKSTLTMEDVLYLVLTGKLKNILLISSTYDAAAEFLEKYRVELDSNSRIINDYGKQVKQGSWAYGEFTTRKGAKFMALGARQQPRGTANAQYRPDCIIFDDFDTDEECLNPDIINKKWDWVEKAVYFTVDVASPYLIIWLGNTIAPDCCLVRASKNVDHDEIVNIRDDDGKSVWPEKNSEEDIDYLLSKVSWAAGQQEYFNNPVREGAIIKEVHWGKIPPIKKFQFLVAYADPSTSNKDTKVAGSNKSSYKSLVLVGYRDNNYYLLKCFLDQTSNDKFIDWFFALHDYVDDKTVVYYLIENNTLQDPFYQQVLIPLFYKKARERYLQIPIAPDTRDKPAKFFRIEATLEPLFRNGNIIFNEAEKENPHMERMAAQVLGVSPSAKIMDGADALEGAIYIVNQKKVLINSDMITAIPKRTNKKRW